MESFLRIPGDAVTIYLRRTGGFAVLAGALLLGGLCGQANAKKSSVYSMQEFFRRTAQSLQEHDVEAAVQLLDLTRTSGAADDGLRLRLRLHSILQLMTDKGWHMEGPFAVDFSDAIASQFDGLDCKTAMQTEIVVYLLRQNDQENAIRIIQSVSSADVTDNNCGALNLKTLAIALAVEKPGPLFANDQGDFWADGNTLVYQVPPILNDEQVSAFTELLVDHRPVHLDRAAAYRFIAIDAQFYGLNKYSEYLEQKAVEEALKN